MAFLWIIWDDENDPLGNVQHIAEHRLTTGEVEAVLNDPNSTGSSNLSGRPFVSFRCGPPFSMSWSMDGQPRSSPVA